MSACKKVSLLITAKIVVWICLAHLWILVCTMVYTEMEGFTRQKADHVITNDYDLVMNILKDSQSNISQLQTSTELQETLYAEYQRKYDKMKYWKIRNEFNDVSKTYLFVLLSYTTLGCHSNMYLQTWQSQLFYIFTMPVGVLLYFVMLHHIATELFEMLAYGAVTIFTRPTYVWTVDQRELYEKCKVFLLAFTNAVCALFLLGTLGIFTTGSFTEGIYHMQNIMLAIKYDGRLFPYAGYKHGGIAIILTFLVFSFLVLSYTVLYSMFIMFRYNGLSEVMTVLFGTMSDNMSDAMTIDDLKEFDEWKQQQQQKSGQIFTLSSDLVGRQPPNSQYLKSYITSETSSQSGDAQPLVTLPKLDQCNPMKIKTSKCFVQPNVKAAMYEPPNIHVTEPTPPGNKLLEHPFPETPTVSKISESKDYIEESD